MFGNEIEELKFQIKRKNDKIRSKKEEFLNMHRKHKSTTIMPVEPEPASQEIDP